MNSGVFGMGEMHIAGSFISLPGCEPHSAQVVRFNHLREVVEVFMFLRSC